jgi:hypothetical protein
VRAIFLEVLTLDGVRFDRELLAVGPIREEQAYGGVRIEVVARLTMARVRLQVDVGFGDAITPEARSSSSRRFSIFRRVCARIHAKSSSRKA